VALCFQRASSVRNYSTDAVTVRSLRVPGHLEVVNRRLGVRDASWRRDVMP